MSCQIEYVICEPRGYPRPLTAHARALMPERVWLTQFDSRTNPPFIVGASGLEESRRIFMAMSADTIIAAHHPADILTIIPLPGIDLLTSQRKNTPRKKHDSMNDHDMSADMIHTRIAASQQRADQHDHKTHTHTPALSRATATTATPPSPDTTPIPSQDTTSAPSQKAAHPTVSRSEKTVLTDKRSIGEYLARTARARQETPLP